MIEINSRPALTEALSNNEMPAIIIEKTSGDARKKYLKEEFGSQGPIIGSDKQSFICLNSFWLKDIKGVTDVNDRTKLSLLRKEFFSLSIVTELLEQTRDSNLEQSANFDIIFSPLFEYGGKEVTSFANLIRSIANNRQNCQEIYTNYIQIGSRAFSNSEWKLPSMDVYDTLFLKEFIEAAQIKEIPIFIFNLNGHIETTLYKRMNDMLLRSEEYGVPKIICDEEWRYHCGTSGAVIEDRYDYLEYDAGEVLKLQ